MCGISGIWHPDRRIVDAHALRRMTSALHHRGPDEHGYHEEPGLGFGHRRLSIIDLDSGRQPLCNEDGSIWVSFNGEIFNYPELRADLIRRGHTFKTRSDTETIVHLYEEKGLDFVHELNGQFAIALWDRARRRLILARDRVGIRPLFHATLADGTLLFGSELKALLAHGSLPAEIDPVALGQIATIWVTVPPRTPFKGIEELGPGRMLVVDDHHRVERRYWDYQFPGEHEYEDRSFEYWQQQVQETLDDAVRLQLRADVPVGAYLSGGLDSSILAALVKRNHQHNLTTFSVAFRDTRFDERAFQQGMVDHLGTDHRCVEVDESDIGQAFSDVIWLAERPLMRTAPAPLLRLSQLVRDSGIKVVLTGEGADEMFGGYNLFREDKARRFWARNPESSWRANAVTSLYGYVKRDERAESFWRQFFRNGLSDTADPYYSHRLRWQNGTQIKRFFSTDVRAAMQSDDALTDELEHSLQPDRSRWHPLSRAQYLESALFMSGYLLSSQGDRMMMGNSVEGRFPFLDHRVIELAAAIPPKFKLRGMNEKYILKKSFAHLLPSQIAERPKQPYRAPIAMSLMGHSMLKRSALDKSGLLDADAVERLIRKISASGGASEREEMALATILSVQLLHHRFVDDFKPAGSRIAA